MSINVNPVMSRNCPSETGAAWCWRSEVKERKESQHRYRGRSRAARDVFEGSRYRRRRVAKLTASSTIISSSISLSLLDDSTPSEGRPSFFFGVALEARATGAACSTTNEDEADEVDVEGTEGSAKASDDLGRAAGSAVVGGGGATLGEVEKMLVADVACSNELEAEAGMSKIVAGPLTGEGEVALVKMFRGGEEGAAAVEGAAEEAFLGEGGSSGAVKMFSSTW